MEFNPANPAPDPTAPEEAVGNDLPLEEPSELPAEEAVDRDLAALLDDTKRERDEYLELAQRTRADFDNYRRRMVAEAETAANRGKAGLAGELISVIDNLERALVAAGIDPAAALAGDFAAEGPLAQGIVLTYRELNATLARAGVESFNPAGERFDPSWHEAIQTQAAEGAEPGAVIEVLQKGYRLDGSLIRPARVVVSE